MSRVALPRCGVSTTFSQGEKPLLDLGLPLEDVERGACDTPARSASTSAASSTIGPRAVFTRTAVDRIASSSAASMRCCDSSVSGTWRLHDVRLGEQRPEIGGPAGEARGRAERLRQARGLATDPTRADDEELLAVEARAEHELERELPLVSAPDEAVALGDPPEEREHQADRELRRGPRQHIGRVGDDDVARRRGGEVDVVDAHCVVRDDS